jgi:hypothetical protein
MDGVQPGEAVIGVLYASGTFELINASQVASVSVGLRCMSKNSIFRHSERSSGMVL